MEEMESCVNTVPSWRIRYYNWYHEDLDVHHEFIEHARREGRRGKLE